MPIRKPKPTSAGRRFVSYPDFAEITKTEPEKSLVEGLTKSGGRNARGRKTARHRGGGAKRLTAASTSSGARTTSPPGGRDRVRPQPLGLHRPAALRRRREALHPRAGATARGYDRPVRRERRHHASATACRWRACRSAPSCTTSSCSPAAAASSPARPAPRSSYGQGRRHGHAAPALGRDAHGPRRVPRDGRGDRQRRPPERQDRQGRPQAPHGRAPADPRHGDEPGRPPARRRRGLDDRRAVTP